MQQDWKHHIGGHWVEPALGRFMNETDPRTDSPSFRIARGSVQDVNAAARAADAALHGWRTTKPMDRARTLVAIGLAIRARIDELARIEQVETGKPLYQARVDIEIAAQYFEFYGGLAPGVEGETINAGPGKLCYTLREPYGVIGVITPWNAPLNQAARAAAPAIAAGNTVVLKPSEFTSVSSLLLAQIAVECGLPPGVLNVVTGTGQEVGEPIVVHPQVAKIAFTGSLRAGREIGMKAAERIIPVTLELGGKSPDIVFADADLAAAARGAVRGFTVNAGQACIAGTRILVERSIAPAFVAMLKAETQRLKVGATDDSQVGPIITKPQFERIQAYFALAREEGAEVITGGHPSAADSSQGYFVEPTIFSGLGSASRVVREEIFGPVCAVLEFDDEAEAVRMANDTNFGLAAGLWTQNLARAHRVAAQLQAGQVYVNEYPSGGIETPFGGYKQSGIGREKGREALNHYVQLKTVIINLGS